VNGADAITLGAFVREVVSHTVGLISTDEHRRNMSLRNEFRYNNRNNSDIFGAGICVY
jgi:hypothetical protein